MAAVSLLGIGGRRNDLGGHAGERDQTHARPVRLCLDEVGRGFLRRGNPVRRHVGRTHRPGDVERQDDRRRTRRHCLVRLRSRRPDSEHAQAQQKQGRRNTTPPQCSSGQSTPHQNSRRHPHGRATPPSPRPPSNEEDERGWPPKRTGPKATRRSSHDPACAQDGEDCADGEQRNRERGERASQRQVFVVRRQPQVDGRRNPVELRSVRCWVVRPTCRLGDRREGVGVQRGLNAIAVDLDRSRRQLVPTPTVSMCTPASCAAVAATVVASGLP